MSLKPPPPDLLDLVEEITNKYGEMCEMGFCVDTILLSLLYKEKCANWDLQRRLEYLENELRK